MKDTSRHAAYTVLLEMERENAYSNIGLDRALSRLAMERREKAFLTRLVNGVTERRLTLDHNIRLYLRQNSRLKPNVRTLLRMGAYELLFCDGVPARASVNEYVALSKTVGAAYASGMINAILRRIAEHGLTLPANGAENYLSVKYSLPLATVACFEKIYGGETEKFLASLFDRTKIYGRINTTKTTFAALQSQLAAEGIGITAAPDFDEAFYFDDTAAFMETDAFRQGLFHIQDLASIAASRLLEIQPGMTVLDVCAAPGGKSFTAAELLGGTGSVTACDIHKHKVALIAKGAVRLGLPNMRAVLRDATAPDGSALYDRIICDVPCSGLGVLRKKPEIRYKSIDDLSELTALQYKILDASAASLKVGGRLVYSTCTVTQCENEDIIEKFLASHENFAPARQTLPVGTAGAYGVRFAPHADDCDGFYACGLIRRS